MGFKSEVEALTGKEQSSGEDGGKKVSLSDSVGFDGAIREILQLFYQDQNRRKSKVERTQLLEKLLRKVQPELSAEQMRDRMKALKEKFKDFNLSDLRALVGGPDIEGQGSGNQGSESQESALGEEPVLRESQEPILGESQEPELDGKGQEPKERVREGFIWGWHTRIPF